MRRAAFLTLAVSVAVSVGVFAELRQDRPPYLVGKSGLVLPKLTHHVLPNYAEGSDGTPYHEVEVQVTVSEKGAVRTGSVQNSIGRPTRDQRRQAVAAIRQWRFEPAMLAGRPVSVERVICSVGFGDRRTLIPESPRSAGPEEEAFAPGIARAFGNREIIPPGSRVRFDPQYTGGMLLRRVRGEAEVQVLVLTDGSVSKTRLVRSLDPEADQLALLAAAGSAFTPATRDGQPIPVLVNLAFSWETR